MNDESMNAQASMCWTCKHGLCIKESEQERLYNFRGVPGQQEPDANQFGLFGETPYGEDNEEAAELVEHTVENERIKTICFWRPEGMNAPPILVANVLQCNRHEKRQ